MIKSVEDAIAGAWNIQGGQKVYRLNFGTSDVDGILRALDEAGYCVAEKQKPLETWRKIAMAGLVVLILGTLFLIR